MSELLFGLLFAHFFADFILQTNRINDLKNSKVQKEKYKGLVKHCSHHFFCYLSIYFIIYYFYTNQTITQSLITSFTICVVHFFIDLAKGNFDSKQNRTLFHSLVFILDQILHVLSIYVVLYATRQIQFNQDNLVNFIKSFLSLNQDYVLFSLKDKIFLIGILVIITTHFYGYLIQIMLKPFNPSGVFKDTKLETKVKLNSDAKGNKVNEEHIYERIDVTTMYDNSPNPAGRYIGMIERLIILILMTTKSISAIGFIIALKALTRFKQFDDKNFSEYYLIGNLLSILLGFLTSYFVLRVINL